MGREETLKRQEKIDELQLEIKNSNENINKLLIVKKSC